MKDRILFSQEVIKDIFNYQYLDMPLLGVYSYFDNNFKDMFDEYSNLFNIKNNFFIFRIMTSAMHLQKNVIIKI